MTVEGDARPSDIPHRVITGLVPVIHSVTAPLAEAPVEWTYILYPSSRTAHTACLYLRRNAPVYVEIK